MKILFAALATVLTLAALPTSASAFYLSDDRIWTQAEIDALPEAPLYFEKLLPGGGGITISTPSGSEPSRLAIFGEGPANGYFVTDGAAGFYRLTPVGDGTYRSFDFNTPPPAASGPELSFYNPGDQTVTLPNGKVITVDLANSKITELPGGGYVGVFVSPSTPALQVAPVPEPGTVGLLLGGAGFLALIARRRR